MSELIARIQAAHARDIATNREAVTAADLPLSYEAITDRWLTAVLCAGAPGASVTGHTLGASDNGSSNRRKIYLTYNAAGEAAGLPRAVFCKSTHDLVNRIVLGVSGGAAGEALFYNEIRPSLDIEAPVAFFGRADLETFNSMIMLNDLSDTVTAFCDHRTDVTRGRAESQMRLLGTLHGTCYGNAALQGHLRKLPTWQQFFERTLGFGMREGSSAGFLASEHLMPARLYRRFPEVWPATVAAVDAADKLSATLAHGDVHLKNWYITGNGEMGLSDWQCCSYGHWGRDLAYTIGSALTVENRRAWERDLISLYLDTMASAGGPAISFEAGWDHYRRQIIPALTWWTVTLTPPEGLPDMQPADVTEAFIHRLATAMDDLDSLDVR